MTKVATADPPAASAAPRSSPRKERVWALLAAGIALAAFPGALSRTSVFYVRDLAYGYWPQHAWFLAILSSGESMLWDPFPAFGQSAIADPCRHLFFPPVVLLRLLLPHVVAFNLTVALAYPVAAVGMFCYLRRHVAAPAAALGGVAFALSGPVLSTSNFPNMGWAVALSPFVLLATDALAERLSASRFSLVAVVFALQFLAAEPVTLIVTAAIATAYALVAAPGPRGGRARATLLAAFWAAGAAGFLLAAIQAFPFVGAFLASPRQGGIPISYHTVGSVHPLSLLEALMPTLFGDPIAQNTFLSPWIQVLNGNAEPIIYSLYVGVPTLALAILGARVAPDRRWALFWAVVLVFATLVSMGIYTPVFPLIAELPIVRSFRFPSKFSVQASFAVAVLAAAGWQALASQTTTARQRLATLGPAAAAAAVAAALFMIVVVSPSVIVGILDGLADAFGLPERDIAVARLMTSLRFALPRLLVVAGATIFWIWLHSARREYAKTALAALFAMLAADLLVANSNLNPMTDARVFATPAWVASTRTHPSDRLYVGLRDTLPVGGDDLLWSSGRPVVAEPDMVVRSRESVVSATYPSAFRLRDAFTNDAIHIWAPEYGHLQRRLRSTGSESRLRYLDRVGTRYYMLPYRPFDDAGEIASVDGLERPRVYERAPSLPRAHVVLESQVVPDPNAQTDLMLSEAFDPSRVVLLAAPPPEPAPPAGTAPAAAAEIVEDATSHVVVRASVPAPDGYLVLTDTYDSSWTVTVDGRPGRLLRANGLFRAVRLGEGEHTVRFEYHPRPFYLGAAVTLLTAVALAGASLRERRAKRNER